MLRPELRPQLPWIQQTPCKRPLLLQSEKLQEQVRQLAGVVHMLWFRGSTLWATDACFVPISMWGPHFVRYGAMLAGQPHRALVFASRRGRAEVWPGPGTSYAAELSMSRPEVDPTSLIPALEAVYAAQPAQPLAASGQPSADIAASVPLEQVLLIDETSQLSAALLRSGLVMGVELLLCLQPGAVLDLLPSSSSGVMVGPSPGRTPDSAGRYTLVLEVVEAGMIRN